MPQRTIWMHGVNMQVEYPNRLTSVRATGPFVRIEGARGQNTWLHFPLPTPSVSSVPPTPFSLPSLHHGKWDAHPTGQRRVCDGVRHTAALRRRHAVALLRRNSGT